MNNHNNTPSRTIVFYQNRANILKGSLPSLYGLLLILPIVAYQRSRKRTKQLLKVLLVFASGLILLFESIFVPALYSLLFRRTILVINEKGIAYTPNITWFVNVNMSIRWEEISAMYVNELTMRGKKRTRTSRYLAIIPKDIEGFIQSEKILRPRRFPLLVMMPILKTPFAVGEPLISPIILEELLAQISTQYDDKIQANGIEIREEQKTDHEGKRS